MMPINDDRRAVGHVIDELPRGHDGGDFKRPSHDGGVARPAAGFGGKRVHALRIEARRLAGGEILGDDDERPRSIAKLLAPLPQQLGQHAFFHIQNVGGAAGEAMVGAERCKSLGEPLDHLADGRFGRQALIANEHLGFARDGGAFQELGMSAENVANLSAKFVGDGLLVLARLAGRRRQRLLQACRLLLDLVFFDMPRGHAVAVGVEDHGCADGHAG